MKKTLALLMAALLCVGLFAGCAGEPEAPATTPAAKPTEAPADTQAPAETEAVSEMDALIAAAQAEGSLVVYGSCEEEYLAVAA